MHRSEAAHALPIHGLPGCVSGRQSPCLVGNISSSAPHTDAIIMSQQCTRHVCTRCLDQPCTSCCMYQVQGACCWPPAPRQSLVHHRQDLLGVGLLSHSGQGASEGCVSLSVRHRAKPFTSPPRDPADRSWALLPRHGQDLAAVQHCCIGSNSSSHEQFRFQQLLSRSPGSAGGRCLQRLSFSNIFFQTGPRQPLPMVCACLCCRDMPSNGACSSPVGSTASSQMRTVRQK